ncbi:MAG: hypothetical protein Q9171_006608 [Xanthocarpia ochracea]
MLSHSLLVLFAFALTTVTATLNYPLSCYTPSGYLMAVPSPAAHGSQAGSYIPIATRCPRVKPTVTITSTITSGTSVVPTRPGFTPVSKANSGSISSRSDSVVISLADTLSAPVTRGNKLPQRVECGSEDSPLTASVIPITCPQLGTVTTSTTVTRPSSVSYDACNVENLATGGYDPLHDKVDANHPGIVALILYNITSASTILDLKDEGDCCDACQQLGCAFGKVFRNECELFFQHECNGKEWLGSTYNSSGRAGQGEIGADRGFRVFNGPCGRLIDGGKD